MADANRPYDFKTIESTWQAAWNDQQAFSSAPSPSKEGNPGDPFYVLEMFPYPSGDLHMGHVRVYTLGDVFARVAWAHGHRVMHPMGWDALGLPAENQAIAEGIAPQVRTPKNIATMKAQMRQLGLSYDWNREIATYKLDYYRWNQWFFIKLLEKGLVYRRVSTVNFCPGCDTILANEQVSDDNVCWRGHEGVTSKEIPEWAFRITAYAQELLDGLDTLENWPERITSMQRNWIGKSVGVQVSFPLADASPDDKSGSQSAASQHIDVFTTRVDTIFGCTYVVLAPEHPLTAQIVTDEQRPAVDAFVAKMGQMDNIERTAEGATKEGVFTGRYATNPYTGAQVPVWVANFVLADYGTGAVMSVPAHDHRDYLFAKAYDLPIKPVITLSKDDADQTPHLAEKANTPDGRLFDSGAFTGLSSSEARAQMAAKAEAEGFGQGTVNWHLRDWGFSRQRYWGTPIPIVYCDTHGAVPVPEDQLPVELPDFEHVELTGTGGAPLAKLPSFYETKCPTCGEPARREVDTMDTFVDSAWYFARFLSPHFDEGPVAHADAKTWLPVDVYLGGPEHAVMHLLYFRFWTKAMRDLGLVDIDEPAKRLVTQGMVNAMAFRCPTHGYVPAAGLLRKPKEQRTCPKCNTMLESAVVKMSKSKYNGVDPLELIDRYGADTARVYTLFAAPPEKDLEWNTDGCEGAFRFLSRIHRLMCNQAERVHDVAAVESLDGLAGPSKAVYQAVHQTLAKVREEVRQRNHFNTAIAAMMALVNTLHEHGLHQDTPADSNKAVSPPVAKSALLGLAQMLAPFAPHLAEEVWQQCGGSGLVLHAVWPAPDQAALVQDEVQIAVQVNGRLRGQIRVPADLAKEGVLQAARDDEKVAKHLEGKTMRKEVYVPGRLVNFVATP